MPGIWTCPCPHSRMGGLTSLGNIRRRDLYPLWRRELPRLRGKEAKMFQDVLFVPDRHWRTRAAALPVAALAHAVALTLLITLPLLRTGEPPAIDVSNAILVPALPSTPLPPPRARTGNPGARIKARRTAVPAGEAWRLVPVEIPQGVVEEGFGSGGAENGVPGGVDYGTGEGLAANLLGSDLYQLVGKPEEPPVRAAGEVRPPRLIRRVEPVYPELARGAGPAFAAAARPGCDRGRPTVGLRAAAPQRASAAGDLHRNRHLRFEGEMTRGTWLPTEWLDDGTLRHGDLRRTVPAWGLSLLSEIDRDLSGAPLRGLPNLTENPVSFNLLEPPKPA
jgi:hypothetical protein